jgi:hypothetical protein
LFYRKILEDLLAMLSPPPVWEVWKSKVELNGENHQ